MHKIITILISGTLLFAVTTGRTQTKGFVDYDSATYKLYTDKSYSQLIKTGKEAIKSGFDYYYIRMRTGIAQFELKRYRDASVNFEKALKFNENDVVREYLYYSYLWGGFPLKAENVLEDMTTALRIKMGLKRSNIFSTGFNFATLFRNTKLNYIYPENKSEEGAQLIPQNFYNASFNFTHRLGKKASMTHLITYLFKKNERYSIDNYYDSVQNNPYYPYDSNYNNNQIQYYTGIDVDLGREWSILLGGHLVSYSLPDYYEVTSRYMGHINETFVKLAYWNWDFALSASILKDFGRASLQGEAAFNFFNGTLSLQPSVLIRLYPFGNLNLYTQSQFGYLINNTASFFQQQKFGFKVFKYLWFEGEYFTGNISGFTLADGSLVFNGIEEINSMAGLNIIVPAGKNLEISAGYQNRIMTNYFITNDEDQKSNRLKLSYSLIYISLLWRL